MISRTELVKRMCQWREKTLKREIGCKLSPNCHTFPNNKCRRQLVSCCRWTDWVSTAVTWCWRRWSPPSTPATSVTVQLRSVLGRESDRSETSKYISVINSSLQEIFRKNKNQGEKDYLCGIEKIVMVPVVLLLNIQYSCWSLCL